MDEREDLNFGQLANGLVRNTIYFVLMLLVSMACWGCGLCLSIVTIGFFQPHANTWKDTTVGK